MARGQAGRFRRPLLVAVAAACVVACSFVTSFDGLTTPAANDAGEGVDSALPPAVVDSGGTSHPGPDATSDATLVDAGENEHGDAQSLGDGSDAGDGGANGTSYCASLTPQPLFCDDFDDDPLDAAALAARWDKVTSLGGSVVRKGGIVTSAPLAMLVTSNAGAAAIDLCGYKAFKSAKSTGLLTLAFDLYVVQPDTTAGTSDAVLAAIELLDSTGSRWALELEVVYTSALGALAVSFSENESFGKDAAATYTAHPAKGTLPIGAWTHVAMEASIGATDVATLRFGTQAVAQPTITPDTVNGYPQILVGGTFAEKSAQGWTVRYDNVTFDVQ